MVARADRDLGEFDMSGKDDGFCFSYEVREVAGKGLGVFAKEYIKKGSVVWRHIPGQYVVYDENTFKAHTMSSINVLGSSVASSMVRQDSYGPDLHEELDSNTARVKRLKVDHQEAMESLLSRLTAEWQHGEISNFCY